MTAEPDDETLPERVREAARGYRTPPLTPREEMWGAILAERAQRRRAQRGMRRRTRCSMLMLRRSPGSK